MAMGRRRTAPQQELFVAASDIRALDNPFYRALNGLLEEHGFDEFAEEQCGEFYAGNRGRPGVPPGVYFRMLMVGYLEGVGFGAGGRDQGALRPRSRHRRSTLPFADSLRGRGCGCG